MTLTREDDKPWKTDLARKSAQRRDQVLQEVEDVIKKAPSFEEALRQAVELMKKRFARYSGGDGLRGGRRGARGAHGARPARRGPSASPRAGGPLADAAQGTPHGVHRPLGGPAWAAVGLTSGSALVAPVRTEAGLWAIVEVWSDFRDAFSPQDAKLLGRVAQALAKKTPAA